ncbi:MAG: hypothetical protein KatS3mg057_2637 [Herpetosiphonaceae bacterium]|nr:MAG: hypothetical protein KatS3mg057_2637 [Herpetosiphonaceae bacterium]
MQVRLAKLRLMIGQPMQVGLLVSGALLLAWLTLALAFQLPAGLNLDVGGALRRSASGAVGASSYDGPYLRGFHAPEPARLTPEATTTFRWTRPQAEVRVPALGPGPWLVTMRLSSGRADGSPADLQLGMGDQMLQIQQPAAWRTVRLLAPGRSGGELLLRLETGTYQTPDDPRPLGVVVDGIDIQQQGWRPWLPLATWALLAGALLILALGGLLAGLSAEALAAGILMLGATGALVLAQWRTALTLFAPTLFGVALAALMLMLVIGAVGSLLASRSTLSHDGLWPVAGLIALGLLIRLAGLRHPQQISSDVGLHIHNLENLAMPGEVFFTEMLTCEAGHRPAPYPPGFYILLAPLLLLVQDHHLLMEAGAALADTLVIGAIWYLVRQGSGSQRAALLASALYLAPPPLLSALGVGEMANVGGQAMALAAVTLALPIVGSGITRGNIGALLLLLTAGMLGHLGVAASFGLLLGCWGALLIIVERSRVGLWLLLAGAGAAALALLLYYSAFIGDPALEVPPTPGCPPDVALRTKLGWLASAVLSIWSITPPLILAVGLAGTVLARRRGPQLGLLLPAWWVATLLSLSTILFSVQTVRWQHFLYPALAAGGGLLLAALWERGRAWRLAAGALLAYALLYGLIFWARHIAMYLH